MVNNNHEFDLIIVGAGLVGASFILAMQQQGLKIAVLEKNLPDITAAAAFRPISLAYGSVKIFATLGIWPELYDDATPIEAVVVCEEGSLGAVHFTATELGVDALGYVVSFSNLYRLLYQKAASQTGVEIIAIQKIVQILKNDAFMRVFVDTVEGARELRAPLVIGCDGVQSSVRKLLTIETEEKYSTDVAFTALITLEKPYVGTALERFTRQGTIAVLPLPLQNQCGLVITLPQKLWEERSQWSNAQWIQVLTPQLSPRVPKILQFEKGNLFPLQTVIAKQQILPGVILLGNAAHTIYPLAAQGFNLGLRDAVALAEILVTAKQSLNSLGDEKILQQYVDWRALDQRRITRLTAMISRFFHTQFPGASMLRGFGLLGVDLFFPLKKRIATMTMGLAGALPKLMRGLPLWEVSDYHE